MKKIKYAQVLDIFTDSRNKLWESISNVPFKTQRVCPGERLWIMHSRSDTHQIPSKTRWIITANEEEEITSLLGAWCQNQVPCFLSCSHVNIGIAQTSGGDIARLPRPWLPTSVALEWQECLESWELKGSGCHPPS